MAQTGFTPIVTYNTATATTVPSAANLAQGELAVNVTDKKLYTKDGGGNVVLLASNGGDVTGPASSTNLALPTFSGTGGKTLLDNSVATISAGVITATGFAGALNGSLGATTASTAVVTSINKMAITAPATSSTLAIADGKTLTANKTLTLDGTDGTTQTFPTTSATIARTDAAQTFTGTQTITPSGLVGLIVNGSNATSQGAIQLSSSSSSYYIGGGPDYLGMTYNIPTGSVNYKWFIGATQAMTLDSSENLLVGTSTNAANVRGNFLVDGTRNAIRAGNSGATGDVYCGFFEFSGQAPNNTTSQFITCNDNAASRFIVRGNGGIANYSANNVNLSDAREKTNIELAGSYLDKICAIPVKTFNYIDQNLVDDAGLNLGVIAQDVQSIAPELVLESNWGKVGEEEKLRLSIYQTDLQYALMKSIQEQQILIKQIQNEINILKGFK